MPKTSHYPPNLRHHIARVRTVNGSSMITIPVPMLQAAGIAQGDFVYLRVLPDNSGIMVHYLPPEGFALPKPAPAPAPAPDPTTAPHYPYPLPTPTPTPKDSES